MFSIRRHASKLIAALLLVLGVALPQVSQAADAFTITAPLASHAVTSCSDVTISGGTIDSAGVSSPSPANKGNVATNGNLTLSGSSTIQGDAAVGPGKRVTTSGTAHVTGTSSVATSTFDCKPIDLVALKSALQSSNDNARIPLTGQHKNPLTGANHTDFVMSGTDTLTLSAGTYYFTSFVVSGSSVITVTGPVHILCSGSLTMSGSSAITGTTSYNLHFWVSGASVALSSATVKGFVYAPSASVSLSSATLVGSIFANSVTLSGSAHVTRSIDDVAPRVAITSPADNSGTSDPAHVLVKGTATDDQTDVSVNVNGQPAAIAPDGTWQITLDLSGRPSPATVSAVATDAAGNTASASIHAITAPPAISLTSPLPGAFVATRTVSLSGAAGTASSLTVNGTPAAIASGVWSLGGFDLGPDGAHTLTITGTNAAGPTTITRIVTDDTTPPTITAVVTPAPNAAGWNRSAATVTFTCSDATSGVATCPAPVTITVETASQVVSGTAIDRVGNQKSALVTVKLDTTAPLIAITAPANGTSVTSPSVAVSGTVSDAFSGVLGLMCNAVPATVSGGTFTCVVPLLAGQNTITTTATDIAGNTASDTRQITLATVTAIAVTPSSSTIVVGATATLTAQATYSDGTTQDVTASATWTSSATNIASVNAGTVTAVASGSATITATFGSQSGSSTITVTTPAPAITGITIIAQTLTPTAGTTQQLSVSASYSDGSSSDATSLAAWTSSNTAVATVNTTGVLSAIAGGSATVTATVDTFTASAVVTVLAPSGPVPDPAAVAPPLDPHIPTGVFEATQFLYTTSGIQTGVAQGTITRRQAAVIRGSVRTADGQPLPDVRISILNAASYGQTRTRSDGGFDFVVNGGSPLTVHYEKSGYIAADRSVVVPWNDFAFAPDVVLVPYDATVTPVDLTSATVTVARGSMITDGDGSRQATLLFQAQTTASLAFANGSTQPIMSLHVRATEYTVGATGPAAMPADLPPTTAYTYCVELSADEAVAAGATGVQFSKPVPFYLENFLNFPVGQIVPVGFYERQTGKWIPSDNGRVVQIVAITAGRAYLDIDGDGLADDSDTLIATTPEERDQLAGMYHVGQTLWRVALSHFSAYDCNWPYGPPDGAVPPGNAAPSGNNPINGPTCSAGSVIECQNQILGEVLPITGVPYSLNYRSDRVPGRVAANTLKIALTGPTVPSGVHSVELSITVAGQQLHQSFTPTPNQSYTFTWNGRDAYGRIPNGTQATVVRVGNTYGAVYQTPKQLERDFAVLSGVPLSSNRTRQEVTLWQEFKTALGTWNAGSEQLGGWTLSVVHAYNPYSRTLYEGNGTRRSVVGGDNPVLTQLANGFGRPTGVATDRDGNVYVTDPGTATIRKIAKDSGTVSIVAGNGSSGFSGDGGPATAASIANPNGITVTPDGVIYFTDTVGSRIRRIAQDGTISTIAGSGGFGLFISDGTSAVDANVSGASHVAATPGGEVYFSERPGFVNGAVYRIDGNGTITRVAGGGGLDPVQANGGDALSAELRTPYGLATGDDGSIFVVDNGWHVVHRVTPDGKIHLIAGTGSHAYSGDGGQGRQASFDSPQGLTRTKDGSLFVADTGNSVIRRITTDGIVSTVAGGGSDINGDGGPATGAAIDAGDVATDPDGNLIVLGQTRILGRVGSGLPGVSANETTLASDDGGELFVFDALGRHLRTLDAHTQAVLYLFTYSHGLLSGIIDVNGRLTRTERDVAGVPTAIVAPDGQRTSLVQTGSYLTQVSNPAGESFLFSYTPDGLLTSMQDPRGNSSQLTYDASGLLVNDQNAAGGFTHVARIDNADGTYAVTETTAMGRLSRYDVANLSTGKRRMTTTAADGTQTVFLLGLDGSTIATQADGTTSSIAKTPDPRWGMDAPVVQSTTTTPGHRILSLTEGRTVVLSDPEDPLSLVSETRTIRINNRLFTSVFDRSSGRITATTPAGRQTTTFLDGAGRVSRVQSAGSAVVQYEYDVHGFLTTASAGSRSTALGYDSLGELTSITDPLSRVTSFGYDAAGRVVRQTMPDQREILFSYDAGGNLTGVTPPSRPRHAFSYGLLNETRAYTAPLTGSTQYTYNLDGQLTAVIQSDGTRIDVGYDTSGRPSSVTNADGQLLLAYDPVNGTLRSLAGPAGSISYSHDGPLLTGETWSGVVSGQVGFTYDNNLRITAETVNGGNSISYGYDADGLIASAGALTLSRDAQRGLLTTSQIGVVGDSYLYNDLGEVTSHVASVNGTPILSLSYTRDAAGRLSQTVDTTQETSSTFGYGYDDSAHLAMTTRNGAPQSTYAYDANGNRLSQATATSMTGAMYDDEDRLLTYGASTYTYTSHGDLQSSTDTLGTTTYKYDAFGNLLRVTLTNGTVVDYVVDARNRRIAKQINGTLTQGFLYSSQLNVVAELDSNGAVLSRFVYAISAVLPTYMTKGGSTYRLIPDHLGSPRLVVDVASGSVAQRMDYDEFGNVTLDTNPGFQPFGFAGGLYDRDTNLVRFGARDYDPRSGRWTNKDPAGFAGGDADLYSYAFGDPVNFFDPSGLIGFGYVASETTEVGSGRPALGQTGSAGVGFFADGVGPTSKGEIGKFRTWGGVNTMNVYRDPRTYPAGCNNAFVVGAFAGGGIGWFLTNANRVADIGGPFHTASLNFGWHARVFALQVSWGSNGEGAPIWVVNYGGRGTIGGGYGVSASYYDTDTVAKRIAGD
jgi:RHS repeat-associated protein